MNYYIMLEFENYYFHKLDVKLFLILFFSSDEINRKINKFTHT